MNFEEQILQDPNPSSLNLGENAFENKSDASENDNESYFGKPENYDYSGVELPENYCYNEELLNEFNELAGKYNLSQKGANELMSMAVKLTKLMGSNYSNAIAEQNRQKINNYKQMLASDSEIGGVNLSKVINSANLAYTEFADDEVRKILADTGLNCHPKFVKMFYNIGKKMANDSVYGVDSPAAIKENREDILFPTM